MIGVPSQQYRKKPTMQQTELADLHFVDAKRIKELGNAAELPAYRTMVRCLDETSVEKNREQLEALLRAFGKERQHFIDLLFTRDHRAFCIGNRWRKLRDALVMEKYRSSYGLQARHWKMALQTPMVCKLVIGRWRFKPQRPLFPTIGVLCKPTLCAEFAERLGLPVSTSSSSATCIFFSAPLSRSRDGHRKRIHRQPQGIVQSDGAHDSRRARQKTETRQGRECLV